MEIVFKHLTPRSNPELFHDYLSLLYKVYISEQGWRLESNHRRKKVEVTLEDIHSFFVVAVDSDNKVIGGVKGTMPTEHFGDRELFDHHLGFTGFGQARGAVSVLSGLAVKDEYRQRKFLHNGKEKSVGQALIEELQSTLVSNGAQVVFSCATVFQAALLLGKESFVIIDEPVKYDGPSRAAIRMGWSKQTEIAKYFRSRQKVLLNKTTSDEFIKHNLKSAAKPSRKVRASAG